jgi:hypothetical protein
MFDPVLLSRITEESLPIAAQLMMLVGSPQR